MYVWYIIYQMLDKDPVNLGSKCSCSLTTMYVVVYLLCAVSNLGIGTAVTHFTSLVPR